MAAGCKIFKSSGGVSSSFAIISVVDLVLIGGGAVGSGHGDGTVLAFEAGEVFVSRYCKCKFSGLGQDEGDGLRSSAVVLDGDGVAAGCKIFKCSGIKMNSGE